MKKETEGNDSHSIETIMSDSIIRHTNALLISKKELVTESNAIKIPLTADIEHKQDMRELPNGLTVVKGSVNNRKAWILRDTGCTTICVSTRFAEKLEIHDKTETKISLAIGSECLGYEIEIDIKCPYIQNTVLALIIDCPFANSKNDDCEQEHRSHTQIYGQISKQESESESGTVFNVQNESLSMYVEKRKEDEKESKEEHNDAGDDEIFHVCDSDNEQYESNDDDNGEKIQVEKSTGHGKHENISMLKDLEKVDGVNALTKKKRVLQRHMYGKF